MNDSLLALGGATENLTGLLRDTLGLFIEPARIKKTAKAELEVAEQKFLQEVSFENRKRDLAERAKHRIAHTEVRRQENLELIGSMALMLLPENATPEKINIDWLHHYASCAQDVSEDELRELWARLLAQEATKPGEFSKRTLDYLKSFSVEDCKIFEKILPLTASDSDSSFLIYNTLGEKFDKFGLTFLEHTHLFDIGLLVNSLDIAIPVEEGKDINIRYFRNNLHGTNTTTSLIQIRVIVLTNVGSQLVNIVEAKPSEDFYNELISELKNYGLTVVESRFVDVT